MQEIFDELCEMYDGTSNLEEYVKILCDGFTQGRPVVGIGAGRMGYALRAHIMRLSHLGYQAFFIGDTTLPRVDTNSIVVINTSSGETPSNILFAEQARAAGCFIVCITSNKASTIALQSDLVVATPAIKSHQLMKSIYEQFSFLLFDYVCESVVNKLGLDRERIVNNHSILE